jgi:hypothetical protein
LFQTYLRQLGDAKSSVTSLTNPDFTGALVPPRQISACWQVTESIKIRDYALPMESIGKAFFVERKARSSASPETTSLKFRSGEYPRGNEKDRQRS